QTDALADIDQGKMDGFAARPYASRDVMGYHTAREIPNYWAYARRFVLQDHMFESVNSWSLPSHLYMVSGWSPRCTSTTAVNIWTTTGDKPSTRYTWADLTYLLAQHHVSCGYYVFPGTQPDCANDKVTCKQLPQNSKTGEIWNPLPHFADV